MKRPLLTMKQENACLEYLSSGNKTDAYRKAFNCVNMKPATINRKAKEFFDRDKIKARVEELRDPIVRRLEIKAEKTLKRLMQGQEFDVRRLYHDDGTLKMPHELDDDTARAIVGVKYKDGFIEEYKTIDVKGCCELIGRHLKLFTDKLESSVQVTHSGVLKVPPTASPETWGKKG
jgi:phage terminase small subunit